jgi:hypothetical protein
VARRDHLIVASKLVAIVDPSHRQSGQYAPGATARSTYWGRGGVLNPRAPLARDDPSVRTRLGQCSGPSPEVDGPRRPS